MATSPMGTLIHHLRRAAALRAEDGPTDVQLLDGYIGRREEAAFEAIVRRHGPLVLGVCRRVLGDPHDAEDAFQATFLVLARKAASIASRELLANWLYGVAYNTSLRARAAAARRRARERQVIEMPDPQAPPPSPWPDLQAVLDEELNRLPDRYRAPVVLCDLEGKTRKEAARQLGWPEGTLSGRLSRARALLAGRLVRRGLVFSGASLAAALSQGTASACLLNTLVSSTVHAARLFRAGQAAAAGVVSHKAAALAEGVLTSMCAGKLTALNAAVLGALLFVAGAGGVAGLCHGQGTHPSATAPDAAAVPEHVRRLGSPKFREREAARRILEKVGEPALEALRKLAADGPDLEARRRAEGLIRTIERRWELRCLTGHTDAVAGVALSPEGRLALSAGRSESSPRLWDVQTGQELRRFVGHTSWVWSVAFTPDGRRALSCGVDGIRLWDVATGKELRRYEGHTRQVYRVTVSADGSRLLSCGQDGTARLWDVATGKELCAFVRHAGEVFGVAFSPDGRRALSCSGDAVWLWDVATGEAIRRFPGDHSAAFAPDGRSALCAGRDAVVRLWDLETGKEVRRLRGHAQVVSSVAFSPDGKRALSGSDDGTVRLWDVATEKELRCLRGHTAGGASVLFTRDGRRALSCSYDRTIRLWALPK